MIQMTVDQYILNKNAWQAELGMLRKLVLKTGLEENIKWGAPVYSLQGKNVVGLVAFKAYVGLWFYQGVFLKDNHNVLVNAQEGKTQAMRHWRFKSIDEMDAVLINAYLKEAIKNQEQGKEIKPQKKPLLIPKELQSALNNDVPLAESFEALSRGKKRDYAEYIAEAKRQETKQTRLAKIIPMISQGIGLHDKYKK